MLACDFVIQSRLTSTRLPYKAALEMPEGFSSIKASILRCERIISELNLNSKIYLACPIDEVHIYKKLCFGTSAIIYGGDYSNVALRFLNLSNHYNLDYIIRVTGDNPYICIDVVEFLVSIAKEQSVCISLFHQKKLPNGTVISFLSKKYLESIVNSSCKKSHEHLIISNDKHINSLIEKPDIPRDLIWPTGRFCLDDNDDYMFFYKNPEIMTYLKVKEMKTKLSTRTNVKLY